MSDSWDEFHRLNQDQRFHLHPTFRLASIFGVSSLVGFFINARRKYNETGLRYLAENSHRLPRIKRDWFFYHKRKNYVCLQNGVKYGFKKGFRTGVLITAYFGLEATFDELRGKIDFLNTLMATVITGGAYSKYNNLGNMATLKMLKTGAVLGLFSGLVQDLLFYRRNGTIWYINQKAFT